MNYLPCVEIEPTTPATAAVIWLHGIFPHAPSIPVTINNGMVMPAWYDILDINFDRKVDEEQLLASAEATQALIDREIDRGIDSSRIVIAGFSQGGAVAYQAALSYPKPLAGLLAMSTYFATVNSIKLDPANQNLPIEIYHGTLDPVVPEQHGQNSVKFLTQMGLAPNYSTYPMEHSVCLEQINDISQSLQKALT